MTGLAILIGGEINSEIEHAAAEHGDPQAKAEGDKVPQGENGMLPTTVPQHQIGILADLAKMSGAEWNSGDRTVDLCSNHWN